MEFKLIYGKKTIKFLEKYGDLRFTFNKNGKLKHIEIKENGKWVISLILTEALKKDIKRPLKIDQNMVLTIKK